MLFSTVNDMSLNAPAHALVLLPLIVIYRLENYLFLLYYVTWLSRCQAHHAILSTRSLRENTTLRASSYERGWPKWPAYQDEFRLGFIWENSARFPRWEKTEDPGDEIWREIRNTKQRWRNATDILLYAYHGFGNPFSSITAVKRAGNDMENSSGKAKRCHSGRLVVWWKCAASSSTI